MQNVLSTTNVNVIADADLCVNGCNNELSGNLIIPESVTMLNRSYSTANLELTASNYLSIQGTLDDANQNLIIVQDEQGESFGVQKIKRKRKKFETANFKIKHNDLFNQFCTEIEYNEFKAIGDNNDK